MPNSVVIVQRCARLFDALVMQNHTELITTDATEMIVCTQAGIEPLRNLAQ